MSGSNQLCWFAIILHCSSVAIAAVVSVNVVGVVSVSVWLLAATKNKVIVKVMFFSLFYPSCSSFVIFCRLKPMPFQPKGSNAVVHKCAISIHFALITITLLNIISFEMRTKRTKKNKKKERKRAKRNNRKKCTQWRHPMQFHLWKWQCEWYSVHWIEYGICIGSL